MHAGEDIHAVAHTQGAGALAADVTITMSKRNIWRYIRAHKVKLGEFDGTLRLHLRYPFPFSHISHTTASWEMYFNRE